MKCNLCDVTYEDDYQDSFIRAWGMCQACVEDIEETQRHPDDTGERTTNEL